MEKLYYNIKEVAQMFGVSESTLRYWEREFTQLNPDRNAGNRRRYNTKDIEVVKQIVHLLYDQKLSIEGAKQTLKNAAPLTERTQQIAEQLRKIREELIDLRDSI